MWGVATIQFIAQRSQSLLRRRGHRIRIFPFHRRGTEEPGARIGELTGDTSGPLYGRGLLASQPTRSASPSTPGQTHNLQADDLGPLRQSSGLPLGSSLSLLPLDERETSPASRRAWPYGSVVLFAHLPSLSVVGFLGFYSQGRAHAGTFTHVCA